MPDHSTNSESRRLFLERVLAATVAATFAPTLLIGELRATITADTTRVLGEYHIDLSDPTFEVLRTVGGSVKLTNVAGQSELDIIVTRISEGQFAAIEAFCTHDPCGLPIANGIGEIVCPCHGARFTSTGRRLSGPARYDIAAYPTSFDGANLVTITIDGVSRVPAISDGVVVARSAAVTPDGRQAIIRVISERELTISARVVASDGRVVGAGPTTALPSGSQHYTIPIDGLPAGTFFVECVSNSRTIGIARLSLCR